MTPALAPREQEIWASTVLDGAGFRRQGTRLPSSCFGMSSVRWRAVRLALKEQQSAGSRCGGGTAGPLLAQMRSADRVRKRPMFGVARTYRGYHETDAFDPQRTCEKMGLLDRTPTCRAGSTNCCLATLVKSAKIGDKMPASENLFSTLSYALFVAPCAVVVIWVVWRVMAWCRFYTALVPAWVGSLPAIFQVPILIGLLLVAWPLLLLAFFGWILVLIFPSLAVQHGEVPRLFVRSTSHALHYIFVVLSAPAPCPGSIEISGGSNRAAAESFWHWLLVFGPIPVLVIWLVARIWRNQD
jgi:hypothetical protein